jgi:predicted dienelactone hydrolase
VAPTVIPLRDEVRGRELPTVVYVPAAAQEAPLIVFCHGMWGHPRLFTHLFAHWARAGFAVAAPTFPHTNGDKPPPYLVEDVVNQPGDVSFVLDELLARELGDPGRIGVGGYSLGAETALAAGLVPGHADPRIRAVVAIAGALAHPSFMLRPLLPRPLLLVQGAEDKEYRLREMRDVFEAAKEPRKLVTIEGAGHGICQDDGEPYTTRTAELTTSFWNRHLRAGGPALSPRDVGSS